MPSDISGTPRYGNRLSKEEVDELIVLSSTVIYVTMLKFEPVSDTPRENEYREVRRHIPFAVVECSGYLNNTPPSSE